MAANNSATLIVDGFIGAGVAIQAKSFSNVAEFSVDVIKGMLRMVDTNGKVMTVAISTAATMVVVIAGGNYTVTIAD